MPDSALSTHSGIVNAAVTVAEAPSTAFQEALVRARLQAERLKGMQLTPETSFTTGAILQHMEGPSTIATAFDGTLITPYEIEAKLNPPRKVLAA